MFQHYSLHKIFMRRSAVLAIGTLALPIMLFRPDRARFYSYLHRVWIKTSTMPVWLAQSEAAGSDFY
ncbi:membrane protein [[Pantoea] beijingensis]|uniref:Membrane protein n=1 Tax=[Pantoea] beijingensis TaxID=1324864 RepID=A0A443IB47_9GAMM|nr:MULTISPECIES: YbfA family protein [Erwiniaceae]RWR01126.1 membrane protein [[Pantoea] beijingensis]